MNSDTEGNPWQKPHQPLVATSSSSAPSGCRPAPGASPWLPVAQLDRLSILPALLHKKEAAIPATALAEPAKPAINQSGSQVPGSMRNLRAAHLLCCLCLCGLLTEIPSIASLSSLLLGEAGALHASPPSLAPVCLSAWAWLAFPAVVSGWFFCS